MIRTLILSSFALGSAFAIPLQLAGAIREGPRVITDYGAWIVTPVSIGTPPQYFNLVVDTTKGTTWVDDKSCAQCISQGGNQFNRSASSTFINTGIVDGITDDYGTTYFQVGYDNVMLGTNVSNSVIVLNATFGAASSRGEQFDGVTIADGVLGLALPASASPSTYPLLSTAKNQVYCRGTEVGLDDFIPKDVYSPVNLTKCKRAVTNGVFTIWLEDQWESSDNGTHGVLYYGNYDNQHCVVSERKMYTLTTSQLYRITMTSFTSQNYTYRKSSQTIIDSTSPTISVPNAVVSQLLNQLGLPQHTQLPVDVPCDAKFDFQFTFRLGTEHVTEKNLIYKKDNGDCYLAVDSSDDDTFNLGLPFFRGRCVYFNYQNEQVGFSNAATHT